MRSAPRIHRRDFIASSSVCALTPFLAPAGAMAETRPGVLDLGYVMGSDRDGDSSAGRIVPAVAVAGDPVLLRTGVDIGIRGFSAPPETLERRALRAFSIGVGNPSLGTRVRLWRFDDAGAVNVASDASLKTPVDAGLEVFLDLAEPSSRFAHAAGCALFGPAYAGSLRRTRLHAPMTADDSPTRAGLRCGVYIIAGRCRRTGEFPRWRGMHARVDPTGAVALAGPSDFPYVVLTVDRPALAGGDRAYT